MYYPRPRYKHETVVREHALDMLLDGFDIQQVSYQLGPSVPTLKKWLREYKAAGDEIDAQIRQAQTAADTSKKTIFRSSEISLSFYIGKHPYIFFPTTTI